LVPCGERGGVVNCGGMSEDLRARNERRMDLLRAIYESVDSSVSAFVSAFEIGPGLGMDRAETVTAIEYLEERGLVKVDDHGTGLLRLTADGVDRVELGGQAT
jgi:Mn-dependent DtxR family transcriptional regulator